MFAAKYRLGNLTAIVDANGIQQTGATADVMPIEPLADRWQSFGWRQEVTATTCARCSTRWTGQTTYTPGRQ
jgi:transketolase N-terminal domain/subunit